MTGGADAPPAVPAPPRARPRELPRFAHRHPRTFRALRATGLRDAYWIVRRRIDDVKAVRDEAIRRWLHPIVNERVHPFLRRKVHPAVNWWNSQSLAARMEMHCVPRADVAALVDEAGGLLVHVDEEQVSGGYHSCRYWVLKSPAPPAP